MGSKLPTDLFPSPDGESQSSSLGSEGRQLRSRLVEFCNLCQKPMPTSTAKPTASHVHCTCVTPPNTAMSEFSVAQSPKKKKVESDINSEQSKRQLFKDTTTTTATTAAATETTTTTSTTTAPSSTVSTVVKVELVDTVEPTTSRGASEISLAPPPSAPPQLSSLSSVSRRKSDAKCEDKNVAKKIEIKSRHPCTLCSKCFNTPGKLNQHMFSHTGEKPFVCSHCSKAFSSKFKLVRHILIHSDQRQYRCTVCERTFHRKDHLKNHSKVHSPVKRRFKCDRTECAKEYSSILSYRKHMAVHSAEEGNLECKICGKRFETKEDTLFHLKVHAGSRSLKTPADRKYRCDHCDRSFFTGKDVRRHLVVHTGRRDFLCQFCPQRFGRKDHLTRHIKKSHSTSTKKTKTRRQPQQQLLQQELELPSTSTSGVAAKSSKSVDNILIEMFEEKSQMASTSKEQPSVIDEESVSDDLYAGMQGLDSPVDVMKLESSPDIIPIVTIDDKPSQQQPPPPKVEQDLSLYQMPILDANIPFKQYDQYPFESYQYEEEVESVAGPSSSSGGAILPELVYHPHTHHHHQQHHHHPHHHQEQQQKPPQPPPPPYPVELVAAFGQAEDDDNVVKVESEFPGEGQSSTMDLVLPPITNISPSMSSCLLMNPDFESLLTSAAASDTLLTSTTAAVALSSSSATSVAPSGPRPSVGGADVDVAAAADAGGDGSAGDEEAENSLFNFLPNSGELLASLLSSSDPQTNSAPLPGFSQAFHQPP